MLNPMDVVHELRKMNELLIGRLDVIAERLDELIRVTQENKADFYGDEK